MYFITKTCLHNSDPIKPHLYIVKLGLTGVYIIFLILLKIIDCGYSLAKAVLTSTHNLCFEQEYEKYKNFITENFSFLVVKFSLYLNRRVFVMVRRLCGRALNAAPCFLYRSSPTDCSIHYETTTLSRETKWLNGNAKAIIICAASSEKKKKKKKKNITKTCLFEYTENVTTKNENFHIKKNLIFSIFLLKT